ncbi:MAG: sugar phosphate isomerase/epimerase family protein [Christensenella sp.]|uniref:sugar phosphate isomerase/epimerase family protein n=1 Tax=Christensenella sp. TaxID=1935934 RepID=UPI002B20BED8|nr:sugar phosphate isomerase/epimerase family protein [Christensenella sp.]MEA5003624.1 sugar phosphate isomerase/epimerase family protein [Christensenella sp.]
MKFGISSYVFTSPFGSDPYGQFKKAKDLGFDIYEIAVEDFSFIDVNKICDAKQQTGIDLSSMCGAFGEKNDISSENSEYRKAGVQYLRDLVDLAVAIDAKVVAGPMYASVGKARMTTPSEKAQQWSWAVENMKIAADYAGENGVRLAIEPLNRFETDFINTVEQGLELIDRIGTDNIGFLLDTFHMNIEESNIPAAIRAAKGKIFDFHTCSNTRGTPGEDNFDWTAISDAIADAGYDDYCTIESFTPDCVAIAKAASLWRPLAESPEALAQNGLAFLKSVFQ